MYTKKPYVKRNAPRSNGNNTNQNNNDNMSNNNNYAIANNGMVVSKKVEEPPKNEKVNNKKQVNKNVNNSPTTTNASKDVESNNNVLNNVQQQLIQVNKGISTLGTDVTKIQEVLTQLSNSLKNINEELVKQRIEIEKQRILLEEGKLKNLKEQQQTNGHSTTHTTSNNNNKNEKAKTTPTSTTTGNTGTTTTNTTGNTGNGASTNNGSSSVVGNNNGGNVVNQENGEQQQSNKQLKQQKKQKKKQNSSTPTTTTTTTTENTTNNTTNTVSNNNKKQTNGTTTLKQEQVNGNESNNNTELNRSVLSIPLDKIFKSDKNNQEIKIKFFDGEKDNDFYNANYIFGFLLRRNSSVFGLNILWNISEEGKSNNSSVPPTVTMRYIVLSDSNTCYIYRIAPYKGRGDLTYLLPKNLIELLTNQKRKIIKVGLDIEQKVTYLYHNLDSVYVAPISDITSLKENMNYLSLVDLASKELNISKDELKDLNNFKNIDYSKVLNDKDLINEAKKCWMIYHLLDIHYKQQQEQTNIYQYVKSNLKLKY
ncbi:hypothetical protein ABK040_005864 [Willaertia magna]